MKEFCVAVRKPSINEQVKSNVLHSLERHHMRDVFNDFNDFLLYFSWFYSNICITHWWGNNSPKSLCQFVLFKKVVVFTILILFMANSFNKFLEYFISFFQYLFCGGVYIRCAVTFWLSYRMQTFSELERDLFCNSIKKQTPPSAL